MSDEKKLTGLEAWLSGTPAGRIERASLIATAIGDESGTLFRLVNDRDGARFGEPRRVVEQERAAAMTAMSKRIISAMCGTDRSVVAVRFASRPTLHQRIAGRWWRVKRWVHDRFFGDCCHDD